MQNNIVETMIENAFSPRCQDSIAWDNNHVGGFVKPTQAHIPSDKESHHNITADDRAELAWFDKRAADRRAGILIES